MWVKIQRQTDKVIKVLNPINMAPNMAALTKMTKTDFGIFSFAMGCTNYNSIELNFPSSWNTDKSVSTQHC